MTLATTNTQLNSDRCGDSAIAGLIRAHYQFQKGAFISESREDNGWLRVASQVSSAPMWNHVARLDAGEVPEAEVLACPLLIENGFARRPVVYLIDRHDGVSAPIPDAKLTKCDHESWMMIDPGADHPAAPAISLKIEVARTNQDLAEFVQIFRASYQTVSAGYEHVFEPTPSANDPAHGFIHYIGRHEGQPACIGSLLWRDGRACIYNVGTAPHARKKGFAGALMSRMIEDCRRLQIRQLFLQAETGGAAERLYSRLGFKTLFRRTGYRVAIEQAPGSQGPAPGLHASNLHRTNAPTGESALQAESQTSFLAAIRREDANSVAPWNLESLALQVPPAVLERIARCEQRSNLGAGPIWIAAWALLLQRYSQQDKVIAHFHSGAAVKELPIDVLETAPTAAWLMEVARRVATAREIEPNRPLEALLVTDELCRDATAARAPRAPLQCHLPRIDGRLEIRFDPASFDRNTVERLARHWLTLADRLAAAGEEPIASIEMLADAERQELLGDWALPVQTATPLQVITRLIEAQARRTPHQPALQMSGERALTYSELNSQANQLARQLRRRGLGSEDVAGIYLERSPEMIVALLGVLKAGAVALPLDPSYPAERLQFMISDAQAKIILSHRRTQRLAGNQAAVLLLDANESELSAASGDDLEHASNPRDGAYIIYTSGSTGQPKGVLVEHEPLARHCVDAAALYALTPADRVLQFNAISFDAAFEQIFSSLITGATLVVRGAEVWTTRQFSQQMDAHALTVVDLPTAYWRQLLVDWNSDASLRPRRWPRLFIAGGEAMTPESLRLWRGLPLAESRLINAYGPTEATITASAFEITPDFLEHELPKRVPIGSVRGGRRACILDSRGRLVPAGVPGELHLGGPLLARGYVNRPDVTRQRFVLDPFSSNPQDRLYKTGDLVRRLSNGSIEFLGRVDQQVKIRGFRVELGEIENALMRHPKVGHAAVVLHSADSHPTLAAYVAPRNGAIPSEHELRLFLRRTLPDYMIPSRIAALDALPMLPGGKIDRRSLAAAAPAAAPEAPLVVGPRNPGELRLQLLFERILQRNDVGVDASFFELGGDSLQALELIVEIERMSGKNLPLETLYHASSVEALARLLEQDQDLGSGNSLAPLQTGGSRPPLFLVHTTPGDVLGYGNLIYHLDPDQPCYGLQSLGLLRPELSHSTIEEMASYYIGQVRSLQPEGPYYLAGWCYGGIVAVEMAQQLAALGERVAFLGLLETVAPPPSLRIYRYYLSRLRCLVRMRPRHWARYLRSKFNYYRQARLADKMRFRRLERTNGPSSAAVEEQNRRLAQLEHVYKTNLTALKFYLARPYPGRVTLFNAEQVDPGVIPDPFYAWPGLASEIEVHTVPGDHDTMLTEPNVSVLARELDACLRQAQAAESPLAADHEDALTVAERL